MKPGAPMVLELVQEIRIAELLKGAGD